MTRKGKIARLSRDVRDELNRRLDNGEQGVRLVEWLNGLPEVRKVLETDFEGRAITEGNLTEWKNGGFLDWQEQQGTLNLIRELEADSRELPKEGGGVAEHMESVMLARYAATLYGSHDTAQDPGRTLRRLGRSLREVARLRRCGQAEERMQLEREWLELARQKTEKGQREKFREWVKDPKVREKIKPTMSDEEKQRIIEEILDAEEEK